MARQTAQKSSSARSTRKAAKLRAATPSSGRAKRPRKAQASPTRSAGTAPASVPPPALAPPPRKPGYYEALAMYESGVRALQRHDYQGAAAQFRSIIERYPEERELQERSHLYLRVCERETARQPAAPQTAQERVYAATVALNAGDTATALDHLRRAIADSPDSDHAHYIMSVALAARNEPRQALEHLRQAVALNPENRALARQDPDLELLRDVDGFRELVDPSPAGGRHKSPARKRR